MNVTIEGYVSYACTRCNETYSVDGKSLTFQEDTSPESEDDDYIRYISLLDAACASCGQEASIGMDVWEFPESVANYSYYSVQGVSDIQCEFTIEHYVDDEVVAKQSGEYELETALPIEGEDEEDGEKNFNEAVYKETIDNETIYNENEAIEGYTDQYDEEE